MDAWGLRMDMGVGADATHCATHSERFSQCAAAVTVEIQLGQWEPGHSPSGDPQPRRSEKALVAAPGLRGARGLFKGVQTQVPLRVRNPLLVPARLFSADRGAGSNNYNNALTDVSMATVKLSLPVYVNCLSGLGPRSWRPSRERCCR